MQMVKFSLNMYSEPNILLKKFKTCCTISFY